MTLDERAKDIRAVCDCLRYMQSDINRADLPIVSLHIGLAISEAETVLDHLQSDNVGAQESGSAPERATGP